MNLRSKASQSAFFGLARGFEGIALRSARPIMKNALPKNAPPVVPPPAPTQQSDGCARPGLQSGQNAGLAGSPTPIHPALWRASQIGHAGLQALPSGFSRLDAQLPGGGWPQGMLTELIARESGIGELRLLVPVLRQLTRERKTVILLGPPHIPYAPALTSFGIDLDHLLIVQAGNAPDRLWAVEQTLRSASFGALLAWLPQEKTRPDHLRRLQLAAQSACGPVFLFRSLAAQSESSPAPLRLLLLPRAQQQISVQLLKRRGPVLLDPILLDLPQPISAIRLHVRPITAPAQQPSASLATVHAARPAARPLALH
jgi:protein ImuA